MPTLPPSEHPRRLLAVVPAGSGDALHRAAETAHYRLHVVEELSAALAALMDGSFTATLLSLSLDTVDESVARRVGEESAAGTLLLSASGITLQSAMLMERAGAVAILREPLDAEEVAERLADVGDEGALVPLPPPEAPADDTPTLVGSGSAMAEVFQVVARVAPTPSTVLVTGESGTGKEVVARILHWAGPRRERPFVAVNCAAIPEHLLESELFGHERGAFTGAVARRVGRFERANGGTLFLDEIGDMSLVLQAKILRVLEERTLERVGGEASTPLDVRIVAATNQDLGERIREGLFREDLYYRLAVVEVALPPLRERGRDIRELVFHFTAHFAEQYQRPLRGITERALQRLEAHPWPGNVRELRNVMDRAVLLASGDVLRSRELRLGAGSPRSSARDTAGGGGGYPVNLALEEVERDHIRKVLLDQDGHMGNAAAVLGIHRNTLTRKVQAYGIGEGRVEDDA